MDLTLIGRTALITGGSKGIEFSVAEMLAAEGCNAILVARSEQDLEASRRQLAGRFKVNVAIRSADLSKVADQQDVARAFPNIDILVNNAGPFAAAASRAWTMPCSGDRTGTSGFSDTST